MFSKPGKIVLIENKSTEPRFSLSYRRGAFDKKSIKLSYDIINCLVKDQDLLLEIDSSLFSLFDPGDKEKIIEEILAKLEEMKLDYRYRKNSHPKEKKYFGFSISSSQTVTEHVLIIYIPNNIWAGDGFWELLPEYGVTYHILNRGINGLKLLDDIHAGRLLDKDLREYYESSIFDCFSFGQMGIDTYLPKQELEEYLKKMK